MSQPFAPEPRYEHGQPTRTAILYCNLGTPQEPTPQAVRRYLAEFLSDPRVVEIPRWIWWPILHGIILRFRPAKSAAKYASIWTAQGSPLKIWTERQALLLQGWLGQRGCNLPVRYAMRYGEPSIASQLDALKAEGVTRMLVIPAYPQYSGTTTASLFDAVYQWAARTRHVPELRYLNRYHDHPGYIHALAKRIEQQWATHGQPDKLLMSFHGVPARTLELGDPYHCECQKTARLLAAELGLAPHQYQVSFQSRLGRAKWLQPYTEPTLIALARAGARHVDVVCPGFTADCLETLEEIDVEGRAAFLNAGGKVFHYLTCLNDDPNWITALADLSMQHLSGWPLQPVPDDAHRTASRSAALGMGARS